jgi:hypothetical protein
VSAGAVIADINCGCKCDRRFSPALTVRESRRATLL